MTIRLAMVLLLTACTTESVEVGSYRIDTVPADLLGGCQARTEFYHVERARPEAPAVYLGTCGTPRFITEHVGLPGDPSCFALAEGGESMVYFHRPELCGAGAQAARKASGVYLHTPADGDQLLYSRQQIGQVWSRAPLGPYAMRLRWQDAEPSRGGAVCAQNLILRADGNEQPEGEPSPSPHGCRDSSIQR